MHDKANCSVKNYLLLIYEIFYNIAFPVATTFFLSALYLNCKLCKIYASVFIFSFFFIYLY